MPASEYLQVTARWDGTGWLWIVDEGFNGNLSVGPDQEAREIDDPYYPLLLNWFGDQGWELTDMLAGREGVLDFVFKRPREESD